MTIITSRAHGIDISKYDSFFKPEEAIGQLDFVFQRISYGIIRDELFSALAPSVAKVPVRMAYHYLSSSMSYKIQADNFLSYITGYTYHAIACDFETAFNTMNTAFAKTAWDWIQYVKQKTGKPVILYTSLSLYNDYIYPSQAMYGINWNTIPLWEAQWWNTPNPNGAPATPIGRMAVWKFWQYTNHGDGSLYGCAKRTEFDLDVYNGDLSELKQWLGVEEVPAPPPLPEPTDTHSHPYPGVDYYEINRFGVKIYLLLIDMAGKRAEVVYAPYLMTVSQAALLRGAQIAVNGHAWAWRNAPPYGPDDLEGLLFTDGEIVVNHRSGAPFINFTKDNQISMPWNDYSNLFNAVSGFRYLVVDGQKQTYLDDMTKIDNKEKHARSAKGIHRDGRLMLMVADGLPDMSYGLLLTQLADVFFEFGAWTAMDNDSGGSAALWIKDRIVNQPSDGHERPVVSQLLIYTGDQSMEKYTAISKTNNMKLRTDHYVTLADNSIESIPMNTPMEADELYVFPANSLSGAIPAFMQNDKWVHVVSVNGVPKNGWVAIVHMGKVYCTYKENVVTPPATPPASVFITHTFTDELAITKPDGTVQFYNANFTVPNVEYKPKP